MKPALYAHPFSSYSQKVLIALYENATSFDFRTLEDPANNQELARLWPMKRFPVMVDKGHTILEASTIIEHLAVHHAGPVELIPSDPAAAVDVRMLDRFFDNYISTPQQKIIYESLRPEDQRDAYGAAEARSTLDTAYAWLDERMASREWAANDSFSIADCGAAPFLFYADWTHAIDPRFSHVWAYRKRLLARPSVVRAVDEARPYRGYFPLGAPDRD